MRSTQPMRITCPNCGKPFSAWDDLVGKAVQCPKCQHQTVISGPNEALGPPAGPANPAAGSDRPAAVPGKVRAASPASPPSTKRPVPPTPAAKPPGSSAQAGPPSAPRPASPPLASSPPSRPGVVAPRPAPSVAQHNDRSLPNRCPHCKAIMEPNDDLCDSCGYHLVLKKVIDISQMPKRNKATGFERLFQEQLEAPESTSNAMLWVKIVGSLFALAVLWLCLERWWWVGALMLAGLAGLYWMKTRQTSAEGAAGSRINDDLVSRLIWRSLLGVQRVAGWRRSQWPFPRVRSLILRDPAFHDRELAELDNLAELEAMDLEGTGITDAALEPLRSQKQLLFLVLRRTNVTAPAAQRLQHDLPKTLVWY